MNTIDGILFAKMIGEGAANLRENRKTVNDLNVFPIPDGDTGDNMFMTINSGAAELKTGAPHSIGDAASLASHGMLLGARGNSGVILSRIFAGISAGLEGIEDADIPALAGALSRGVDEAYRAVSVPVEGTILTVYRDAVGYASSRIGKSSTFRTFFDDLLTELRLSLDRTPDLLDVLKEAGVVDSGGAGFVYIAEGMKNALDGKITEDSPADKTEEKKAADISLFTEDSMLEFGYCTEFLLRLQRSKVDLDSFDIRELEDYLNSVGDSLVIFRDGSVVKVHVHTMKPGDILNHCQQYGEFLTLKIENMTLQHSEANIQNNYTPPKLKPKKAYGIVSVATGDGIKKTFSSLGVDEIVDGGQSMNPSTEDFIKAFGEINADTILVFPNNGNIIMAASQAAAIYGKADVRVVKTKTIGEGYAAISMLDTSSGDTDAIIGELDEIIAGVVTGSVSKAVRDTEKDGVSVRAGDYIGFSDGKIYIDSASRFEAAESLAEALGAGKYDIALLICGADTDGAEAQELYNTLKAKYRRTEIIMIDGGQPVYDYILILE